MSYKPQVRRDELMIREVGQELVVYDARHRRAHRLNKAAAPILQASDGTRTVGEIATLLSDDLDVQERSELVWATLQDLSQADLLTAPIAPPRELGRSRRNLLQRAAMIGFAVPVIESIVAPPAEAHASGQRGDRDDHRRRNREGHRWWNAWGDRSDRRHDH
jgi:coenzyme PQQ synthesis protein D (PqqD)